MRRTFVFMVDFADCGIESGMASGVMRRSSFRIGRAAAP